MINSNDVTIIATGIFILIGVVLGVKVIINKWLENYDMDGD